mmetsp:Transcript_12933/g.17394  ORF Transcript_12933/g.17394 Transcript_12933/m.17394 type:complete len:87 (+) Transcript_12933:206-466(+)
MCLVLGRITFCHDLMTIIYFFVQRNDCTTFYMLRIYFSYAVLVSILNEVDVYCFRFARIGFSALCSRFTLLKKRKNIMKKNMFFPG